MCEREKLRDRESMCVNIGIVCAANPSEPLQIWIGIAREREKEREREREKREPGKLWV